MSEQTDGQQGAAPATAAEVVDAIRRQHLDGESAGWCWNLDEPEAERRIDAYAERVASARVAEVTKQAREALVAADEAFDLMDYQGERARNIIDAPEDADDPGAQFTARLVRIALAGPHAAATATDPTPGTGG